MQFYPIKADNDDGTYAYILSFFGNTLLFIGGLAYKSLLHYYPLNDEDEERSQFPGESVTKKRKLINSSSSAPAKKERNNYYLISKTGEGYIKGPRKFNLSYLNYINLPTVNFIFLSAIDDIAILPYLTRQKHCKAKIFCTTPVKQIGLYVLRELHSIVSLRNSQQVNIEQENRKTDFFEESDFFDYFEENYGLQISEWCEIFTKEEIEASIKLLIQINHRQEIELNSELSLTAYSTGYQIGSVYWVFNMANQINFAVVPYFTLHNVRHALPFELNPEKIQNLRYLFICNSFSKNHEVELPIEVSFNFNHEKCLWKFVETIKKTFAEDPRSNILIPVRNMLFILDLLDILNNRITEKVKFVIISDAIESIVNYSNANVEYLLPLLQRKILDPNPEAPFSSFEKLKKSDRLINFSDLFDFQEKNKAYSIKQMIQDHTPCIYFICDASMRMGVGVRLLEQFEEAGTKTTVVLTDTNLQTSRVFDIIREKFTMLKIVYSPLDMRATEQEFQEFLKKKNIKIDNIVVPIGCSINLPNSKVFHYAEEEDLHINVENVWMVEAERKFQIRADELKKIEGNFTQLYKGCKIQSGVKGTLGRAGDCKQFKLSDMEEENAEKKIRGIILPKSFEQRSSYFKNIEEKLSRKLHEEMKYFENQASKDQQAIKRPNQYLKVSYYNQSGESLVLRLEEQNSYVYASNHEDLKRFMTIVMGLVDFIMV